MDGGCQSIDPAVEDALVASLTSSSLFPMPFTCIGVALFIACFMSKLQNKNTYLIGAAYSLFGLLETISLLYLIKKYYDTSIHGRLLATSDPTVEFEANKFLLLLVGLGMIYFINMLGLIAQTPILCGDVRFQQWLRNSFHKGFFTFITILSFLTSYKLKLIIFSKLFSFTCARSQLDSVQKFRVFNILSFLGVGQEILIIYVSAIIVASMNKALIGT